MKRSMIIAVSLALAAGVAVAATDQYRPEAGEAYEDKVQLGEAGVYRFESNSPITASSLATRVTTASTRASRTARCRSPMPTASTRASRTSMTRSLASKARSRQ